MRSIRIFSETALAANTQVQLSASAAGHVSRVLRLQTGDAVTLFDGHGSEYPARLLDVQSGRVHAQLGEPRQTGEESPLQLTLAQGVSRAERMDMVIQKATELGVTRIQPLLTERSVVKLDAAQAQKKLQHWRSIAISACEQCGRNRLPGILAPLPLADWMPAAAATETKVLLSPDAKLHLGELTGQIQNAGAMPSITLLIGPEGGLTATEEATALHRGFRAARLGPRILRTETAAFAALAILQFMAGDLQ